MANSKRPRKTGWFGVSETLQKKVRRRIPSWRRVRRRCAIAQIARQWNAKKKVEGNEAGPQLGNTRVATNTYIYSEKFHHQEKVRVTLSNFPGDRVADPIKAKPRKRLSLVCYLELSNLVCYQHIVSQPGAIYPEKFPIIPNYYQQLIPKKHPYSQLIKPIYSPCIYMQYGYNKGGNKVTYHSNKVRINLQIRLNISMVNLGLKLHPSLNNGKFSQWARAP